VERELLDKTRAYEKEAVLRETETETETERERERETETDRERDGLTAYEGKREEVLAACEERKGCLRLWLCVCGVSCAGE
jgi:hypothetical protein